MKVLLVINAPDMSHSLQKVVSVDQVPDALNRSWENWQNACAATGLDVWDDHRPDIITRFVPDDYVIKGQRKKNVVLSDMFDYPASVYDGGSIDL